MLVRGQTTEDRIGEIANRFAQGIGSYAQSQQQMADRTLNQAMKEAEIRQRALQAQQEANIKAAEIEAKMTEQTGKNYVGSGFGKSILSGAPIDPSSYNLGITEKAKREEQKFLSDEAVKQSVIAKNNADAKKKSTSPLLTEGEKKVDTDYAKDINDWMATGKASLSKNLQSLKEARDALDNDPSLTGGLTGILSDRLTADRVLEQRQKVGSAVQGSLRATLGTSFTEGEGKRTLANSYNEAANAKANKASLDKLITELETQAAINDQRAEYFRKNGTLKGFTPQLSTTTGGDEKNVSSGPWSEFKR